MMRALPNRQSGHRKATEEENDQRTCGKEIWKEMWTAGFKNSYRKMKVTTQD